MPFRPRAAVGDGHVVQEVQPGGERREAREVQGGVKDVRQVPPLKSCL